MLDDKTVDDKSKSIKKLSESKKLLTLLESSINESLSKSAAYMKCLRGPSFRDLEFKRLRGLIIPWLDLEKDRSAFAVKSLEYKK